jgi:hypothetical protein
MSKSFIAPKSRKKGHEKRRFLKMADSANTPG